MPRLSNDHSWIRLSFDKARVTNYNHEMENRFQGFIKAGSEAESVLKDIDEKKLPQHVAIIMDGNGRWARQRNLDRISGHKEGAKSARLIAECSARIGIKHLTLFVFSSENWKRPQEEVNKLMELLYKNLLERSGILEKNEIRLKTIGDLDKLPKRLRNKLIETEKKSQQYENLQINLALSYGARMEIIQAIKKIIQDDVGSDDINEDLFRNYLYTSGCPDPDLLIRTSGELRVSNFLLYQIAYSELYFSPTLWPDFRVREYLSAILDYQNRKRRFGAI
jgi:undecaprenyl diphosphate synthase